jgi:type IV pilus assembly protein PilB
MDKKILEIQDVQNIAPDLAKTKILSRETAEKIQLIIFAAEKKHLSLLTTNNFPNQVKQLLDTLTEKGYTFDMYYTDTAAFAYALGRYDQIQAQESAVAQEKAIEDRASGTSALAMIKQIFAKKDTLEPGDFIMELVKLAFQSGASDVHFQAEEKGVIVKVRIDGVLQKVVDFSHAEFLKYMQKLKFISGVKMNIVALPQDGRFTFTATVWDKQYPIDARVNFMPWLASENAVIRFLDVETGLKSLEEIWIVGKNYDTIYEAIHKNTGIVIVSGPTGSWKTTTLYSILNIINDGRKKIITLEDPVEYQLPGIEQSQINPSKGYTFELWLKSVLRHDPDIIFVGETRTLDTAETAINAALTGHLVFTTLHTNSAIESIARLLSMWVKSYMLAPALQMISAQRLVRKLDPATMTRRQATYAESEEIKDALKKLKDANPSITVEFDGTVPQAIPTEDNNMTWYKGRIAVTEVFSINDDIRKLIVDGKTTIDIYTKARENGFLTMKEDGILKVLQGLTTLDELRRVL